jgi:WD40 repeat protein
MTTPCAHLQPLERAMQAAGITIVPAGHSAAKAQCRVYRPALERQLGRAAPVVYREYFEAERYAEDFPIGRLFCTQCVSWFDTLHPCESNLNTPWFPAAPAPLALIAERPFASVLNVTAIACSPSGRFAAVAAGIYNTTPDFILWDTVRSEPLRRLPSHGVIRSIAWGGDDRILITGRGILWSQGQGSEGPSIFVWDTSKGAELLRFGSELFGVRGIALSPDGRTLLASGMLGKTPAEGSTLDLWDVNGGRLLTRLARVDAHAPETLPFFSGVAFTPDGTMALAACDRYRLPVHLRRKDRTAVPAWWGRGVRAWRLPDGQEFDLLPRQSAPVRALSVSSDGTRLLVAGERFGVWNLTNGSLLWDKQNPYDTGVAASPDFRLVARGTGYRIDNHGPFAETAVELYDGTNGEFLSVGRHRTPPASVAFASNNTLAAGGLEGELRFWQAVSETY